jgi:uncharacterized membrane protein YphA (DoxX/SURF4 family)
MPASWRAALARLTLEGGKLGIFGRISAFYSPGLLARYDIMFYRVDYVLAVLLGGFLIGMVLKPVAAKLAPHKIARTYLFLIAAILLIRAIVFICSLVTTSMPVWNSIGSAISDITNFLLGILFGVSVQRTDRRELLCDPDVFTALCLAVGIGYVIAGYTKAFYMQGMADFFTQSGYSIAFLKFIMTIEVLGGAALLIPWTVLPALAGLSIDMFGAIWTHVHNGDPLNDSTGAIASLIRIAVIASLWAWRPRAQDAPFSARRRLAGVAAAAVFCFAFAVAGSRAMRHPSQPQTQNPAPHASLFGPAPRRHPNGNSAALA